MSTKKLSQQKSNPLEKIAFHAVCFEGVQVFEDLKESLEAIPNKIILEANEDHKNFLKSDVVTLQQFQKTKTEHKRYFLSNLNLRNTVIQNMLLKVVEEPSDNTVIIFVVPDVSVLLGTLVSRLQIIQTEDGDNEFEVKLNAAIKNVNTKEIERLLYIKKVKDSGAGSQKQIADYLAA